MWGKGRWGEGLAMLKGRGGGGTKSFRVDFT